MRSRALTLPFIAFGAAFIAAATLQPIFGSFSKVYRFDGEVARGAVIETMTPTPTAVGAPVADVPAATAPGSSPPTGVETPGETPPAAPTAATGIRVSLATTPTPFPPGFPTPTVSPLTFLTATATPTPTEASGETPTPTATPTATPTPAPGETPTPTATPQPAATPTQTPAPTATSVPAPTSTPTPPPTATPTPDPCGSTRDALLAFVPADLKLIGGNNSAGGVLRLENRGGTGYARQGVVRVTIESGASHVSRLTVLGKSWQPTSGLLWFDVEVGDIAPAGAINLPFSADLATVRLATLATDLSAPAIAAAGVALRFEVASEACGPRPQVTPTARVQIVLPSPPTATPSPIPTATPTRTPTPKITKIGTPIAIDNVTAADVVTLN